MGSVDNTGLARVVLWFLHAVMMRLSSCCVRMWYANVNSQVWDSLICTVIPIFRKDGLPWLRRLLGWVTGAFGYL